MSKKKKIRPPKPFVIVGATRFVVNNNPDYIEAIKGEGFVTMNLKKFKALRRWLDRCILYMEQYHD